MSWATMIDIAFDPMNIAVWKADSARIAGAADRSKVSVSFAFSILPDRTTLIRETDTIASAEAANDAAPRSQSSHQATD